MYGWQKTVSCLRKYEISTEAESGSRRKIFEFCLVDPSGVLKFIKQDMDKAMEL